MQSNSSVKKSGTAKRVSRSLFSSFKEPSQSGWTAGASSGKSGIRIALIYFNAGGGHRAAASALRAELARRHPGWDPQMVNLFDVLDPKHRFKRLTGFAPEHYYNQRLATGFTLGLAHELKVLQAMIRVLHKQLVARLMRFWQQTQPDMVVSLVPNFNRAIAAGLARQQPGTPFVTVMTDLADYPPNFWAVPGHTEHLVCGTTHAYQQAVELGIDSRLIHQVSGMMLSPKFYEHGPLDQIERVAQRSALGFGPDDVVGLVMFGGQGSSAMKHIAAALADQPLILMCGRHESLRQYLQSSRYHVKHHVVGFTDDVAHWMRLADYFIGKPGPGSISEALHCGLPVIVTRNAWTMPQERWNTDFIRDNQLGCVVPGVADIAQAAQDVIAKLNHYRLRVRQFENRAIFEVAALIETLMQQPQSGPTVALAVNQSSPKTWLSTQSSSTARGRTAMTSRQSADADAGCVRLPHPAHVAGCSIGQNR